MRLQGTVGNIISGEFQQTNELHETPHEEDLKDKDRQSVGG